MRGARLLERDGYPPGVPCWIDTAQPDPVAATAFYGGVFGWEFEDRMPANEPGRYFVARLQSLDVAAVGSQLGPSPRAVWNTYIAVASADLAATKVRDAGGTVLVEPFEVLDAGRMAVFSDPTGAAFSVWQAKQHRGAQLVNYPGTWNWSNLNTRDPERARAFYGEVFGWNTDTGVIEDIGDYTMLRMPGYGDFLEGIDPDLRRRQADDGAPEGFADAIAWLMPVPADQHPEDVASHWSVTFAVDDTDRVADRTTELGGEVVIAPFDAGVVRAAVLRDPQGASFSVSKYDPG